MNFTRLKLKSGLILIQMSLINLWIRAVNYEYDQCLVLLLSISQQFNHDTILSQVTRSSAISFGYTFYSNLHRSLGTLCSFRWRSALDSDASSLLAVFWTGISLLSWHWLKALTLLQAALIPVVQTDHFDCQDSLQ